MKKKNEMDRQNPTTFYTCQTQSSQGASQTCVVKGILTKGNPLGNIYVADSRHWGTDHLFLGCRVLGGFFWSSIISMTILATKFCSSFGPHVGRVVDVTPPPWVPNPTVILFFLFFLSYSSLPPSTSVIPCRLACTLVAWLETSPIETLKICSGALAASAKSHSRMALALWNSALPEMPRMQSTRRMAKDSWATGKRFLRLFSRFGFWFFVW